MNIVLWILQILLAAQFLFHGWLFLSPPANLAEQITTTFSPAFRIFLGIAELLAGVGLILPSATRIMPWLTPLAAAGIMIILGNAAVFHLLRGEVSSAITTAIMLIIASFVAYMRWRVKSISVR